MFRFLMLLALMGTFVGVVVGGLAIGGIIDWDEAGCPFGHNDTAPGSASTSCKSRPEPKQEQLAAVLDGSALSNGLAAFKRSKDARVGVVGVGLNAYGETTFSIPDGKNAFGAPEYRHVTFDRAGKTAPDDNAFRREYATTESTERVPVGTIRPAAVKRALARVRRGSPDATFTSAKFSRSFPTTGLGWTLQYSIGSGTALHGFHVELDADGRGLCVFGQASEVRGLKPCGFEQPGIEGAAPPSSAAPAAPQNEQLACIQKAAGDVVKMQKCVTGS